MMMKDFVTGLIFGAVIGGSMALLNSPSSGEENRRKLKKYTNTITYAAKDLQGSIAEGQIAVTDLAQQGISSAKVARDEITMAIRDFNQSAVPQLNTMQKKADQLKDHLQEAQIKFTKN